MSHVNLDATLKEGGGISVKPNFKALTINVETTIVYIHEHPHNMPYNWNRPNVKAKCSMYLFARFIFLGFFREQGCINSGN